MKPGTPGRTGRGRGVFQSRPGHLRDRRRSRPYAQHGLTTLKTAVRRLGGRAIDQRTAVGRALAGWRGALIDALGGDGQVTPQQETIIELAVRSKLIVDSIDTGLLAQPSLVNYRRRALLPVVIQRQQIANGLVNHLEALGLERRGPRTLSLAEYLARPPADPPSQSDGDDDA
jgi:hypothetical protein